VLSYSVTWHIFFGTCIMLALRPLAMEGMNEYEWGLVQLWIPRLPFYLPRRPFAMMLRSGWSRWLLAIHRRRGSQHHRPSFAVLSFVTLSVMSYLVPTHSFVGGFQRCWFFQMPLPSFCFSGALYVAWVCLRGFIFC
jgi:hypothetical protein